MKLCACYQVRGPGPWEAKEWGLRAQATQGTAPGLRSVLGLRGAEICGGITMQDTVYIYKINVLSNIMCVYLCTQSALPKAYVRKAALEGDY